MEPQATPEQIQLAADKLRASTSLVVLTGAGVSKESGIPTFRDAIDGLWQKYDPVTLATPQAFSENPKLVWDWNQHRRDIMRDARPNPGHYALAQLEDILPQVVVITQNIDGLHKQAGSSDVIELHGNLMGNKCFANCQGDPTLVDITRLDWDPEAGPPTCPHCGAYVRPSIVWFNELLPLEALDRAKTLSMSADVMLIVGTSGVVQPAASLPYYAKRYNETYIIDVNPIRDELTDYADLFLAGPAGGVLPRIVQVMREAK